MPRTIVAARAADIPAGEGICVIENGEEIAVFNVNGAFFACSGRCPHAGGPLYQGFLRGTRVVCPWHGWDFELDCGDKDLRDGVERYKVWQEGENVLIELPD